MDSFTFKETQTLEYSILAPNLWQEHFKMFELHEIMRQCDSKLFVEMLNRLRESELGEQGCRSGESTRLPRMWPGFDFRTRRHMWLEFVVGSLPCSERFFSGYSGFPLSSRTSKFQFDPECSDV